MSTQLTLKHWLFAISLGLLLGGIAITPLLFTYRNYITLMSPPIITPNMIQAFHHTLTPVPKVWLKQSLSAMIHLEPIDVRISFYTGLAIENGGYEELNALGHPLNVGSIAAPSDIPFGTQFFIEDLPSDVPTSRFVVDDRGGAIQRISPTKIKLDIYVKRLAGENDKDYFVRVNNLGIIHTTALYKKP